MHKVREVIVPVQVGAVKIYVATTMEPLRKKGKNKRQGETQEPSKLMVF
jgi:hypothetical protein